MDQDEVVRALKDERFREGLSPEQSAALPANPAGIVELRDDDLEAVVGGLTDQTGTGGAGCQCVITQTAVSGGGTCYCTCPSPNPTPVPVEA